MALDKEIVPLNIEELEDDCLMWKNMRYTLPQIRKLIRGKYGIERSTMHISRMAKKAALRAVEEENFKDYAIQQIKGISELNAIHDKVEKMIDEKVIIYKYIKESGEEVVEYKTIPPMVIAQLANVVVNILEKKNQIRGISNSSLQMQVINQYMQNNKQVDAREQFQNLDPAIQEELRKLLQDPDEVQKEELTEDEYNKIDNEYIEGVILDDNK